MHLPVLREHERKRILLGQLGALGDCLYATAIARQIKHDNPDCHLTWAIGSMARSILEGNPDVDDIWEVSAVDHADIRTAWWKFEKEAKDAKMRGVYDEIYLTQIAPGNFHNFDGTVRYSMFRAYPRPITVPVDPVLFLNNSEVENVRRFAQEYRLEVGHPVILFECSAKSGQTFVTVDFAKQFSRLLVERFPDSRVVLSSNSAVEAYDPRIIDGSTLTFRENAELTKYCSLLIGGSSGVSWLCTSTWAKPLPMIQLLEKSTSVYASFVHDYEHRSEDTNHIIEMTDCSPDKLFRCTFTILTDSFASAKAMFHEQIPLNFDHYFSTMAGLLFQLKFLTVLRSICCVIERYGIKISFFRSFFVGLKQASRTRLERLIKQCEDISWLRH